MHDILSDQNYDCRLIGNIGNPALSEKKITKKTVFVIIAVTGTNGKSSIADFYYQILDLNNKKVASIGTLGRKYSRGCF